MPVLLQVVGESSDPALIEQLEKIYQDAQPERLKLPVSLQQKQEQEQRMPLTPTQFVQAILDNPTYSFYCALFNERLIGAVVIEQQDDLWSLSHFCVRKITRRRRVGSRLLELIALQGKEQQQNLIAAKQDLVAPDHIILQRMGYQLNEQDDYYQLTTSA